MKIEINASRRAEQGTGASRRLRRQGKVPGILYGGTEPATSLLLDQQELYLKLKQEAFHSSILTMQLDGTAQQVLLRDVQMHPFRPYVMHADFQRVDATHRIHVKVPLHFINAEVSSAVKLQGGIVSHVINELDVSCLPADLPEYIEVDLKDLSAGASLHVSDLKMPNGVEVVLHKGDNPVVASIVQPKGAGAEEAEASEAAAAPAAPAAAPPAAPAQKK